MLFLLLDAHKNFHNRRDNIIFTTHQATQEGYFKVTQCTRFSNM